MPCSTSAADQVRPSMFVHQIEQERLEVACQADMLVRLILTLTNGLCLRIRTWVLVGDDLSVSDVTTQVAVEDQVGDWRNIISYNQVRQVSEGGTFTLKKSLLLQ
jgi:hypothetical protein